MTNEIQQHPLVGSRVVAVLPNGFIHFGVLQQTGRYFHLTDASNLRRWVSRKGGLPEFAQSGPVSEDLIDRIGEVYLETVNFFYPCGAWNE